MNVDFQGEKIHEILNYLLQNQSIEYKIVADNILLRKAMNYESMPDNRYQNSLHLRGKVVVHAQKKQSLPFAIIAIDRESPGWLQTGSEITSLLLSLRPALLAQKRF